MVRQSRNRYDEPFKKKVVLCHRQSRGTLAESAARFGITAGMLSKWVERYGGEDENSEHPAMNYAVEIKHLQGEVSTLKEIMSKIFLQKHSVDEIAGRMMEKVQDR
jgi:transposase-like protein